MKSWMRSFRLNKKKPASAALALAALTAIGITLTVATAGANPSSLATAIGFAAPEINGTSNIPHPEVGAIVLDSSDGHFYGNDDGTTSGWKPLSKVDSTGAASGDVLTANGSGGTSWQNPSAASVPTGTILPFAGATPPSGFLLCDGTAVSRTTYSALFAVIDEAYGEGDGSTTFHIPDFRGRFLRGVDDGAGTDPDAASRTAMASGGNTGDAVGSVQDDAFQGHWHNYAAYVAGFGNGGVLGPSDRLDQTPGSNYSDRVTAPVSDGTHGSPRTSAETRPKNAYVNFIIKY